MGVERTACCVSMYVFGGWESNEVSDMVGERDLLECWCGAGYLRAVGEPESVGDGDLLRLCVGFVGSPSLPFVGVSVTVVGFA